MKHLITLLCLIQFQLSIAQISDDFSDGDFTNNPTWSGDDGDFTIDSEELHLDAASPGESYLTTSNTDIDNAVWEFLVKLDFATSSQNRAYIYLVSDISDLDGDVNGYYVLIGNTSDEISLYRQDATTTSVEIIDGVDATVMTPPTEVRIRVTRDALGNWELFRDLSGGTSFTSEGAALDNTYNSTLFYGVLCDYSTDNVDGFIFDDISVSTTPVVANFGITSLSIEGTNAIRVTFNQNVDETTAETLANYSLNYGFGNPTSAVQDMTNLDEVLLTFSEDFVNNDYTLNIDQVQNEAQDETISDDDQIFNVEIQTPFRDIVINEIMADPTPVVSLPDAEYLELYNTSDQDINIGDFEFDGEILDDFVLPSHDFVILTDDVNTGLFSGNVLGLNLSLTNSGKVLELFDNLGNLVDSVSYSDDWYENADKDDGGYSLEQINPELACSYENNWTASNDTDGGTPSSQNSVYDDTPDTDGPNLIDLVATSANTFLLTFDEPMDESSLTVATYGFDNGISENGVTPISPGYLSTSIEVTPDLISGTTYTVTVTNATDCAGNAIQNNTFAFTYDTSPPELSRIIVKNTTRIDLLFDEALDQSIAETESNYSSDHSGANPSSAELDESNFAIVSLTFDLEFELGVEHTLTIDNLEDTQGNALASTLTPTFTYTQDVDSVFVIGINLLDIYFDQDLDESSALNTNNYVVDDEVGTPSSAFIDSSNERLVHLAFANNFDDNKDLTLSIRDVKNDDDDYLTTPEISFVYDTSPPKLDTIYVTSSSTLEVVFAEKVESQSAQSKENYEYDEIYPIAATLEEDQKTVLLEFAEEFEREVVFELYIDEVKDLYKNGIKTRIKQAFVYDIFEPQLDSIIVRSANELVLWFNENVNQTVAENVSNYAIGASEDQPNNATLDLEYQYLVYLTLDTDLPEESNIDLAIIAMEDQRLNPISSTISATFDYDVFYIGNLSAVSQNSIEIEFNKVPDLNTKNTLANYSLNEEFATDIEFSEDRKAIITFSSAMEDNSENQLQVENITDQNSNNLSINTYTLGFDSRILSSSTIGDRTVALEFEVALDIDQDLTLSDFNASPSLGNCGAAIIDNEQPEILRLTFENAIDADVLYSISWQNLINEYGNNLPNYSTTAINDQTAPSVDQHLILNDNMIWIKYSEPLNEGSAEFLLNYSIAPSIGHPTEAKYAATDSSVLLEFSSSFSEVTNYTLSIDNIEDLADNALFDHMIEFNYEAVETPDFGDLIITEIMADPTPEVGLSDKEYIEVYNTSDKTISLVGISIVDEGGTTTIVSGEIESGHYIVLTSTSGATEFLDVKALAITSFPSLNNSGETISLYAGEQLIFSTTYSTDWYKNSEKEEGGWSLEMIDVGNPCGEYSNWTASSDAQGGTPGLANSVEASNPDNFGPELVSAVATSDNSIQLTVNEKLHPVSFLNANILLTPARNLSSSMLLEPKNTQIELSLEEDLETGQSYEIELSNVSDCLYNAINDEQNAVSFRLPELANPNDIVINEVLFNPNVGGVDFVEIYNNSEKAINLKNWALADKISDQKIITNENLVLDPFEYLAFTPNPAILITEYPKGEASKMIAMNAFPGLSDTEDSVLLISNEGLIIDEMKYEDDYHFNLLDDDDGVSLERVSFEAESFNPDSWKSAASTVGYATPGNVNSQFKSENQSTATVSIDPRVFIPDNSGMDDYTTINYQLDQSGNFANVHIYSVNGVLIKTLAEGELLSTTGFFTWDGTTNNGSQASVGYYMVIFEIFDGLGNK
ncbi:lamin tail domain-containing protein, partial [Reichenbachiella sp.]